MATSHPRRLLHRVTELALIHPGRFLIAGVLLTAVSAWLASGLEVRSSFEELLPQNLPSVVHLKELMQRIGGEGTVLVNVETLETGEGLAPAETLASKLAQEYLRLGPSVIRAVESDLRPVEKWYADHWPLFASLEDLKKADQDLQRAISDAKAKANPLSLHLDDEDSAPALSGEDLGPWANPNTPLPRELVAQRFRSHPNGFFVNPDGRSVTIIVRPNGSALSVKEARELLNQLRAVADRFTSELEADHLQVSYGGTFPILVAEYEAILNDVRSTALLVVSLVLGSLLLFFRDLRSTLALGIAMLVALAITFGLTRLAIGYLNTQTAFLWAIVLGNGINYGLIYLARVRQLRRAGTPLVPACLEGAQTAASATLLASAASSVSFGLLTMAANRGFHQFGFIGGVGMLLSWVATFTLLPALLSLFERIRPLRPRPPASSVRRVPALLQRLGEHPVAMVTVFGALTVISVVHFIRFVPRAMELNLENVTNELSKDNEVARANARAQRSLGQPIEGVIGLLPSAQAADEFCGVIRQRQQQPRWASLIENCETLSSVVPADQDAKLAVISRIQSRISDLLLEKVDPQQSERLRQVRSDLAAQRHLALSDAPPTLVDPFRERDGTVGRIAVVTARGSAQLELQPNLEAFVDAVRNVPVQGKLYEAAGEDVVVADLLRDVEREGPRMTFFSLAGVCILAALFLRSARDTTLVVGSLVTGVILMGGLTALLDLKINFFNFVVFPITFGIAVDYAANVATRIRERGGEVLASLTEVGPVVALCSWTSIIGYASLLFSVNRGLRSFGWYALIGEVTSIICALVLLPALRLMLASRRAPRPVPARVEGATSIPRGYARAERNGLGVLETTSQDEIS
jgi:predicted RND superfamily exporter protein